MDIERILASFFVVFLWITLWAMNYNWFKKMIKDNGGKLGTDGESASFLFGFVFLPIFILVNFAVFMFYTFKKLFGLGDS